MTLPTRRSLPDRVFARACPPLLALLLLALPPLSCSRRPQPAVPIPPNIAQLDPQLRHYIEQQLEVLRKQPSDGAAHATLGLIYAANDLWAFALPSFSNAVVLAPADPQAALYVGVAAGEAGDLEGARAHFESLTRAHPAFAPGWFRLGEMDLRLGRLDDAAAAFRKLVELAPREWRGHASLGDIAIRRAQPAIATNHLSTALGIDPQARTARNLMATALRMLGQTNEASWHAALGRNAVGSPMPDAWAPLASGHMKLLHDQFGLADQLAAEGRPDQAVNLLRETLRFHPDNAEVINRLAVACNRAGRAGDARNLVTSLLQRNPTNLSAWITLSFAEAIGGRFADALVAADRAVALGTNIAQPYIARANALLGMERDEDAIRAFEEAARIDPNEAEIQLELGDVLWRNLEKPADARVHYHRARAIDPSLARTYVSLAELERALGNQREAEAAVATLRQLRPGSPELRAAEEALRGARP